MKYTYPSTLDDVVSEYIYIYIYIYIYMIMGVYLQNPRSSGLLFPPPSGGRRALEIKYSYLITLGDVVSE